MPVTFIWPGLLWGLLLVPAVLALYMRLLRRALPESLPHPYTPLVAIAASHGKRFTRYLPAALLLLAPPGTARPRILEAIDGLGFVRRTAIGEGLLEAVVALPERFRPGLDGTLPAPSGPPPPAAPATPASIPWGPREPPAARR